MSSLFSISDTNFDDLDEDEGFLIEACSLDVNQNCNSHNSGKTPKGHNNDKIILSGNHSNVNSVSKNVASTALLRPLPASAPNNTCFKNGKRAENTFQCGPPKKRSTSPQENNSTPIKNHHGSKVTGTRINGFQPFDTFSHHNENSLLDLHSSKQNDVSISKNKPSNTSHGLRYTQNTSSSVVPLPNVSGNFQQESLNTPSTSTRSTKLRVQQNICRTPTVSSKGNNDFERSVPPVVQNTNDCSHGNQIENNCLRESPARSNDKRLSAEVIITPKTRRFPGPAGILPRLEPGQNLEQLTSTSAETPKQKSPELCRMINDNENDEDFYSQPWTMMQDEIVQSCLGPPQSLVSVIQKATSQQLDNGKVAFLSILVKSCIPSGLDASVVLKDPSGEMRGTLHRKVLEEHPIEPGCGLFLKQVSVFSPSPRKHYLNIIPGNIIEIFPVAIKDLISPAKAVQETPKRQPCQTKRRPTQATSQLEHKTKDNHISCEGNFDELLQGLESDDDMLVEAMSF